MSDESDVQVTEREQIMVQWRQPGTILVDGVIAMVGAAEIHRVTFGELIFNPNPDAETPQMRPVVTLAMTTDAMENVVQALQVRLAEIAGDLANEGSGA